MTVADPGMTSSWSLVAPGLSAQGFSLTMDSMKLERARMMLSEMAYSKATRQDEDGDT